MSRQMSEGGQGRGPLSSPPSPLLATLSLSLSLSPGEHCPLGFSVANLPVIPRFKQTTGSALGYGFLPTDRVCVSVGSTFTDWSLRDAGRANTFVAHTCGKGCSEEVSGGLSPVPAQAPAQQLEAQLRGCVCGGRPISGSAPPPEPDVSGSGS